MIKKVIIVLVVIIIAFWLIVKASEKPSKFITWSEAESKLQSCEVSQANQDQSLEVTLYTKDNSVLFTKAPEITSLAQIISQIASKCGKVKISVE